MICNNMEDVFFVLESLPKATKVGITSGCFDLIHPYHVEYLRRCSVRCDYLIVMIDSDSMIQSNKQKCSIMPEKDRSYMLDAIRYVNMSYIMNAIEELSIIAHHSYRTEHVTSIFKSDHSVYGAPLIKVEGVSNEIIPDIPALSSTTQIIDYIRKTSANGSSKP